MHELRGRLSLLDPTAGDALKVIEYFDRLVASQVSIETLVRGAATLAHVNAGYNSPTRLFRFLAGGLQGPETDSTGPWTLANAGYRALRVGPGCR
ncbi:hypothetical protein [Propioniciclava sinopodophylli]|uniref:hypothetical protein n=1 Tax=Propioniciclava sinopodophylli TaxID=1837344 RepID=UPI00248FD923|nr:hypothetical protein [Propioniciclava sinopodophylli]